MRGKEGRRTDGRSLDHCGKKRVLFAPKRGKKGEGEKLEE